MTVINAQNFSSIHRQNYAIFSFYYANVNQRPSFFVMQMVVCVQYQYVLYEMGDEMTDGQPSEQHELYITRCLWTHMIDPSNDGTPLDT